MKRYLILAASVILQMCLGATYSWSVYVGPLRALTGAGQGAAQIPFSLFYFVFPVSLLATSGLLPRFGPTVMAVSGALLFGGGWFLAGFGAASFALTAIGVGVLGGMGVGLAYVVPITTCMRWFPERRGLVTGVSVVGFGGGAALISHTAVWLMTRHHLSPFEVFRMLGVIFVVVAGLAGLAMRNPSGGAGGRADTVPSFPLLRDPAFRLLYGAMFAGLSAGFLVNANLKQLSHVGTESGAAAVSAFALANALGRIVWGLVFDRIRPAPAAALNLAAQAVVLLTASRVLAAPHGLIVLASAAGFNYGGVLVVYAAGTAHVWGLARVASVYGKVFSANIPAAFMPILAGLYFDRTGSFTLPLAAVGVLLLAAAIWMVCRRGLLAPRPQPETRW